MGLIDNYHKVAPWTPQICLGGKLDTYSGHLLTRFPPWSCSRDRMFRDALTVAVATIEKPLKMGGCGQILNRFFHAKFIWSRWSADLPKLLLMFFSDFFCLLIIEHVWRLMFEESPLLF